MSALVVLLLLAALIFGGIGLFIEGLMWVLIIAAGLAVASFVVGALGGRNRV